MRSTSDSKHVLLDHFLEEEHDALAFLSVDMFKINQLISLMISIKYKNKTVK